MNVRPIHSLEEDFQELGVLDEMDPMDRIQKQQAHKQNMLQKQMASKQAALAKQQARQSAMMQKRLGSDIDHGDDFMDEGDIDEARIRIHRMSGGEKAKARKSARKYRRTHKQLLKRIRSSKVYKLHQKALEKIGPAKRGFRRRTKGKSVMQRMGLGRKPAAPAESAWDNFEALADVVESLRYDTNIEQVGVAFQDLAMFAREVGSGFHEISEEYVSTAVDYAVMGDACQEVAEEAMEFATAISEHGEDLPVADQELLLNHLQTLAEELDGLCDVYETDVVAIEMTEGGIDEDDLEEDEMVYLDADDVAELLESGVEIIDEDDLEEVYGEAGLKMKYGHGNSPKEHTFNIMHPLGISRVDQQEKLILRQQLARETAEDLDY